MIGRAGVSSDQWGGKSKADEAETDGGNGPAQCHQDIVWGALHLYMSKNAWPWPGDVGLTRLFFLFLAPLLCQQIGS